MRPGDGPPLDPASIRGLRVWRSRFSGQLWSPGTGTLLPPAGWSLLPSGDAYLTRGVKIGPHWVLLERDGRFTATVGVLCPGKVLEEARQAAESTAERRAARRRIAQVARSRRESAYRGELEASILAFLRFAPPFEGLARTVAHGATVQATEVRSGRVGRSGDLPLMERAELAARAYLRHRHTGYETQLRKLAVNRSEREDRELREDHYWVIKGEANAEVDAFLARHRSDPRKMETVPSGSAARGPGRTTEAED